MPTGITRRYNNSCSIFYSRFADRYDSDPRIAYLQTGFGLWAEYHIYDGPMQLGKTFPSIELQQRFLTHMDQEFKQLKWMISIDSADEERSPAAMMPGTGFGLFDDSFLCKEHPKYNASSWKSLGPQRWQKAPAGGEFSYYSTRDQRLALSETGPHGISFEVAAKQFHVSFMIGNDQPEHQSFERIRQAGLACGYRFVLQRLETNGKMLRGAIRNEGVAPIYYDAYPAANGLRSKTSLRNLLPGNTVEFVIDTAAASEKILFSIAADRLVPSQSIPFEIAKP